MEIRAVNLERDFQAVQLLWEQCSPGIQISPTDDYEGLSHKLEQDPELFLVAVEDDHIIASVIGGYDGRRGLVYHLAVAPEFRRRGVARQLMDALENRLRALGCYKYYLLVVSENDEAQAFYRAFGCEPMDLQLFGKVLG